jgi:hypothetical protein
VRHYSVCCDICPLRCQVPAAEGRRGIRTSEIKDMSALVLDHVLDQYAIDWRSGRVESLGGGGGFSGAQFWRLTVSGQLLCLRRWPTQHPNRKNSP